MNKKVNILIFISVLFLISGCANQNFIVYSLDGEKVNLHLIDRRNVNYEYELYFERSQIEKEYDEVYIIATNNFHYGHFFYDNIFMQLLDSKVRGMKVDAIIYEKNRKDYPDYADDYIYFTAINYK